MGSYRLAQRKCRSSLGNQPASQLLRDPVPQCPSARDECHMAELAARPFRLAVVVQVQARPGEQVAGARLAPDDVDHDGVAAWRGAAERQPRDGAHVGLELAGLGALDRPVAGIVDARRHLVCDQPSALDEILDAEHADVAERAHQPPVVAPGEAVQPRVRPGRAGDREDAVGVHVLGERVSLHVACPVARRDERDLAREFHHPFVDEWLPGEARVAFRRVADPADADLPLAVVAEAARLQDAGRAECRKRVPKVRVRVHGGIGCDRNAEALENPLLGQAVLRDLEGARRRPYGPDARDGPRRRDRHVFPVEGDDVDAAREAGQPRPVVEVPGDDFGDRRARYVAAAVVHRELEPERDPGEGHHPAELAGADDADAHGGLQLAAGSGRARTSAVCRSRNAASASRSGGCRAASIAVARRAALRAPASPIATVATGTPTGICTIESSESRPLSAFDWIGTPITGSSVLDAVMPGRCAAPPAPAMSTSRPRPAAPAAYSNRRSGVRCAEMTRHSKGTPSAVSWSAARRMVSQSDDEPMMMPTSGFIAEV